MFFDTSSEHDLPLCTHDIIKGMTLPEIKPVTFRVNLGKIITERKRERERARITTLFLSPSYRLSPRKDPLQMVRRW